jgi:hypothetical protein
MTKKAGSVSGSTSQRHGSADPDPDQNVMEPQHWFGRIQKGSVAPVPDSQSRFGSKKAKTTPKMQKQKIEKCHVLKA